MNAPGEDSWPLEQQLALVTLGRLPVDRHLGLLPPEVCRVDRVLSRHAQTAQTYLGEGRGGKMQTDIVIYMCVFHCFNKAV